MRPLTHAVAVAATILAVAGCGESRPHGQVLHVATASPAGIERDAALQAFAARLAQVSGGRLRVAFDNRWGADGSAHEATVIHDVAHGRVAFGVVSTRSLARAGARELAALDAPMLVDRSTLEQAVLASPLGARLLAATSAAGVQGLALLAGPLAHPVGTRGPIRRAADARRRSFYLRDPEVAAPAARALGAFDHPLSFGWLSRAYVTGPRVIREPALYEDDLDTLFFDRYGGQCADPDRACRAMGPWVTVNVALWPRMSAIVADPAALARLGARERAWVRAAAAAAAARSAPSPGADQGVLDELCAAGVRAARATPAGRASLARAWAPLDEGSPTGAIRAIRRMRRSAPPDPPLRIPRGCGRDGAHAGPARGVRSTVPDGVYRARITTADLRAARADRNDDRAGTATLTLRGGRWRLTLTEPGRRVEAGTYAGTPQRTAWEGTGPAGRDEAYMSIAVGRDGALRFAVARADDLPRVRALLASHPWRRIGA